jgi:virulence-associated protein VagC
MKAHVKTQGLLIPKKFLRGVQSAEIRWENSHIIVEPTKIKEDPVFGLGENPGRSGSKTVSEGHDQYLYGKG